MSAEIELPEPEGYRTEHDDGDMFWRPADLLEARTYCEDDIEPEPLYTATTVRRLIDEAVEREREACAEIAGCFEAGLGTASGLPVSAAIRSRGSKT